MAGLRGAVAALVLLLAAVLAAAEAKRPKLRCSAGLTLYAEGRLRVFGVPFHGGGEWGSDEYACLGARRRPLPVGVVSSNGGTGSLDTLAFAFGGGRYLGSYHTSDGEGGGEGWFAVVDLETRRTVVEADAGWHDTAPPFRVAANGALITEDEDIEVRAPGSRHAKTLSTPGVTATDL
ncbi:MAG: hypothetical protein ABI611_08010, partial [Solirubrobacteraceae bacterium]